MRLNPGARSPRESGLPSLFFQRRSPDFSHLYTTRAGIDPHLNFKITPGIEQVLSRFSHLYTTHAGTGLSLLRVHRGVVRPSLKRDQGNVNFWKDEF